MGSRSLTSSTFKTAREEYVEICRDRHRRKLGYREGHGSSAGSRFRSYRPCGSKLGEVGQQAKAIGAESLVLELDLMAPTAAEVVVKETLDRFGCIDALVNIAGAVAGLDVFRMTDEQWNTGMELKFHGARRLSIRAWDALRESKGAVVLISGNAAVIPKGGCGGSRSDQCGAYMRPQIRLLSNAP
jgi:NAD(P)-dependent dehydrogenase (short-subunit alcohol dehydrogenase family)